MTKAQSLLDVGTPEPPESLLDVAEQLGLEPAEPCSAETQTPSAVAKMFAADQRITVVREYLDGWVPNAYKYRATGAMIIHHRDGRQERAGYDRKRSRGIGPALVGFSARGGRLASI